MIVTALFDGDDMATAEAQHSAYDQALRVLLGEARNLVAFAYAVAGSDHRAPPLGDLSVDHRTVQTAHDILGAVWRFRSRSSQPTLPLHNEPRDFLGSKPTQMQIWIWWLRDEVRSWIDAPSLVRLLWTIVENQNTGSGYEAEDALAAELLRRFDDVPWTSAVRRRGRAP